MNGDYVRLRAGGEQYAAPVAGVREISPLAEITPVPGAPAGVLGVWNLRGDVVAAIDLAAIIGIEAGPAERILVVEDGGLHVGMVVEEVLEVGPLPGAVEPIDHPLLAGSTLLDRTPVGLLDLTALLAAVSAELVA